VPRYVVYRPVPSSPQAGRPRRGRWLTHCLLGAALLALLPVGGLPAGAPPALAAAASPAGASSISRAGQWLIDGQGRVVVVHGVNLVHKTAPFYPDTFTAQDAQFLASEGFTVALIGFIWQAVEPQPGVYDDAYVQHVVDLDHLLAQYGIRTLVDFHQNFWSIGSADGAPAWATLGTNALDDFQAFWDNDPAPDGAGIQAHFDRAWAHVASYLSGDTNVLGLDPLNEPQPGPRSGCAIYSPCPQFEATELASFYGRVIQSIRQVDPRHVIFPEGVADNSEVASALPAFADAQTAFTFHQYCPLTQTATSSGPLDALCATPDQQGLDTATNYARQQLGVPAFVGEFSSGDANDDNATMVDLMGARFLPWTIWAYYTYSQDPANTPAQGLLLDDNQPGSEANAKQAKLDAIAVPYATAIADTPASTSFDRTSGEYDLTYYTQPVPGATLIRAPTTIFLPQRAYPNGYHVDITNGSYTTAQAGRVLQITPARGAATVTVRVTKA